MHVLIESPDPSAALLRDVAQQRVRFVMRRLAQRVPRATVRLSDINGPRGGVDKHCSVELQTLNAGTVVVSSVASDFRIALDRALARACRVLTRLWRRSRQGRRSGRPAPLELDT